MQPLWIALASSIAVACGAPSPGPSAPKPVTIEAAPVETPQAATATATQERKRFGTIARLSERELGFDEAELLSGEAANRAAAEAGDEVDNDYYIRDKTHELATLPIAQKAEILLLPRSGPPDYTSGTASAPSSISALLAYFNGSDPDSKTIRGAHYNLSVRGGVVTKIEEAYFP